MVGNEFSGSMNEPQGEIPRVAGFILPVDYTI